MNPAIQPARAKRQKRSTLPDETRAILFEEAEETDEVRRQVTQSLLKSIVWHTIVSAVYLQGLQS